MKSNINAKSGLRTQWEHPVQARLSTRDIVRLAGLFLVLAFTPRGEAAGPVVGFEEAEGFANSTAISVYTNWTGTQAEISDGESAAGTLSLKVWNGTGTEGSATRTLTAADFSGTMPGAVVFGEIFVLPGPTEEGDTLASLFNLDGAVVGFGEVTEENVLSGRIDVIDEDTPPAQVDTGVRYAVTSSQGAEGWQRVNVRADYQRKKWDLYVNGQPVLAEINMPAGGTNVVSSLEVRVGEGSAGAGYFDSVRLDENNLLFTDGDKDGMPDDYELAHGLNPQSDDRLGDLDGDGMSNILEFMAGRSPSVSGTGTNGQTVFVDAESGSDVNTGKLPYAAAGPDGPKASIGQGVAAATTSGASRVLVAAGTYSLSTLSLGTKDVRLIPRGNVHIAP